MQRERHDARHQLVERALQVRRLHGGAVQTSDLRLLAHVGNRRDELPVVAAKVKALLGLGG